MKRILQRSIPVLAALVVIITLGAQPPVRAATLQQLSGSFGIDVNDYDKIPMVVGLADASNYWSDAPVALPDKTGQIIGKLSGVPSQGSYTLALPDTVPAKAFDVTTGATAASGSLYIYAVRLISDVAQRGYMLPNEDVVAASLKISLDYVVQGGKLLVYAADDKEQFPTGVGADKKLFTADDPRTPIPAGWSVVDLDQTPFTVSQGSTQTVDLITAGAGGSTDYTNLACDALIPAFLDRVQKFYPFTELYKIDWDSLRAKLIPEAKAAQNEYDCEKVIRDFGNAIPDGHVNWDLPLLRLEYAGSLGMGFTPLSDGRIAVSLLTPTGPANAAGIKLGAVIQTVDNTPVLDYIQGLTLQYANASTPHALLAIRLGLLNRGPLGSKVSITYQNPGEAATTVTLTRALPQRVSVKLPPATKDNVLPSGMGYVRIPNFTEMKSLRDADSAIDSLIAQNVPGIILDVRDNPGGLSQISDAIASRFFDKPFIIATDRALDKRAVYQMQIEPRTKVYSGLVAVLVNVNTSSAGDLFAYTFASSKRALIVGTTPSGGLFGTVSGGQYFLPGKAFIQVPTGGSYDAGGNIIIEGKGVAPDVLVPVTVESITSGQDTVLKAAEDALLAGKKP